MAFMVRPLFFIAIFVAAWPMDIGAATLDHRYDSASLTGPYSLVGDGISQAAPSQKTQLADNHGEASSSKLQKVRAEFDKLGCAPLTAIEDAEGIRVTGFMSSEDELNQLKTSVQAMDDVGPVAFQVVVISPSFCEILQVSLPLHERNGIESAGASIGINSNDVMLEEGDQVVLNAIAPTFDSFVYVVYMQEDGKLINLMPSETDRDNRRQASESFSVGARDDQPSFSVAPPYGDDLVILLASSEPLFSGPRSLTESGSNFAKDLAQSVNTLLSEEGKVVADLVFLRTSPRLTDPSSSLEGAD